MSTAGSIRSPPSLRPLAAVLALLAGLLAMVGISALVMPLGLRLALAASELMLVGPGLLALAAADIPLARGLALRRVGAGTVLLALATGLALWLASLGLFELQYTVWRPPPGYLEMFRQLHEALRPHGALDALFSLLAIAILPAACEESLLRGIVLPSLLRHGADRAVLLSAALFAAIHLDPYRFPFTFVLGLALGTLRVRTGSLLVPLIVHAFLNATTFVAVPFLDEASATAPTPQPGLGAALLVAGGGLALLLLRRFPALTRDGWAA